MFWEIAPAVPLNPTYRGVFVLYQVDVFWFAPVNAGAVFGLKTTQVETLVPPDRNVRRGRPLLQIGIVGTLKRTK